MRQYLLCYVAITLAELGCVVAVGRGVAVSPSLRSSVQGPATQGAGRSRASFLAEVEEQEEQAALPEDETAKSEQHAAVSTALVSQPDTLVLPEDEDEALESDAVDSPTFFSQPDVSMTEAMPEQEAFLSTAPQMFALTDVSGTPVNVNSNVKSTQNGKTHSVQVKIKGQQVSANSATGVTTSTTITTTTVSATSPPIASTSASVQSPTVAATPVPSTAAATTVAATTAVSTTAASAANSGTTKGKSQSRKSSTTQLSWPPKERYRTCDPPCIKSRGVCNDNVCFCKSPYTGTTCQHRVQSLTSVSFPLAIAFYVFCFFLGVVLARLAFLLFWYSRQQSWKPRVIKQEVWQPPQHKKKLKGTVVPA